MTMLAAVWLKPSRKFIWVLLKLFAGCAAIVITVVLTLLQDAEWADQSLFGVKLKLRARPRSQTLPIIPEAIADSIYGEAMLR